MFIFAALSDFDQFVVTAFATFLAASGGFWLYLKKRMQDKDASTQLLMGLAHDVIMTRCVEFIDKGFVTRDEFDDLIRYFYDPYISLGGNGSVERMMTAVKRLPLTMEMSRMYQLADSVKLRHQEKARIEGRPSFHDRPIPDFDELREAAANDTGERRREDDRK